MRLLLASTAIALLFGLAPASAMCGGGEQAGGMCGASSASNTMSEKAASEWPMAPGKAAPEQPQKSGMMTCPCCKNMAMMDMNVDDPHKGMDMKPKE
jgi:hypothetical protein